ncbi:MAG: thioredoxin family protein [Primorskyibacter sp.]
MQRRSFLTGTATILAAALPGVSWAEVLFYMPGLLDKHLAQGDTVVLDFTASWCSTCQTQRRVLAALKDENPAYDANLVFIDVDWDRYGRSTLVRRLRVPSRSTLVVMKGDTELARIVAGTSRKSIKDLLDVGLDAALAA